MTVKINAAREFLLDDAKRKEYDRFRNSFKQGSTTSTSTEGWQYEQEWTKASERVQHKAEEAANLTLEDLLNGLVVLLAAGTVLAVGAAAVGTEYAWKGTDRYRGATKGPSFGQLFWCGIGGWACVICLIVPGTSIITFYCFYWAFFPGPDHKFIGCSSVLSGMLISASILVPVLVCLSAVLFNFLS